MKISSLLTANQICIGWPEDKDGPPEVKDKWTLIRLLTSFLLNNCPKKFDETQILEAADLVIDREKSMTTGIGHGVAIPHASVPYLKKAVAAVCTIPEGVEFDSIDHAKVRVIYLILLPDKKFQDHIQLLANIAKISNDPDLLERVANEEDAAGVWKLLDEEET